MADKIIKNVVIYIKVSTEEQTEGLSLQNQLDSFIRLCERFQIQRYWNIYRCWCFRQVNRKKSSISRDD